MPESDIFVEILTLYDCLFYLKYGPCHEAGCLETWQVVSKCREATYYLGQSASSHQLVKRAFFSRLLSCYLIVSNLRNLSLNQIPWQEDRIKRIFGTKKRYTSVYLLETLMAEGKLWTNS